MTQPGFARGERTWPGLWGWQSLTNGGGMAGAGGGGVCQQGASASLSQGSKVSRSLERGWCSGDCGNEGQNRPVILGTRSSKARPGQDFSFG